MHHWLGHTCATTWEGQRSTQRSRPHRVLTGVHGFELQGGLVLKHGGKRVQDRVKVLHWASAYTDFARLHLLRYMSMQVRTHPPSQHSKPHPHPPRRPITVHASSLKQEPASPFPAPVFTLPPRVRQGGGKLPLQRSAVSVSGPDCLGRQSLHDCPGRAVPLSGVH